MSYDLYADFGGSSNQDVDALVRGSQRGVRVDDLATRIRLLAGVAARGASEYAVVGDRGMGGYKSIVHDRIPSQAGYAKFIKAQRGLMTQIGVLKPVVPSFDILPLGSWLLRFEFTLARPYVGKDDDPFYVSESVNPVRKDKIFKVPMVAASSWKGLLRWTIRQLRLVERKEGLSKGQLAEEQLRIALLFGSEKVVESATPHRAGRIMCYPTFFDLIDLEVLNPHLRKNKAGTHPIYLECVPAGAKGTFSLLYVPFDLVGHGEEAVRARGKEDLLTIAESVQAIMLTYGFSAKRTSGFGEAKDRIDGAVWTRRDRWPVGRLGRLPQEVESVEF